ncbi:hypothetical protein J6A31_03065 [bacterium]|nr:hypothetical protein [bacterium]
MRISAIRNTNYCVANQQSCKKPNVNFNGLFKNVGSSSEEWDYHGIPSGSSGDGHYQGMSTSKSYIYHPFKGESESHIKKVLEENNYHYDYDPDSTGGYSGSDDCTTERGKTLPFTEKEWNSFTAKQQEYYRELLNL